MTRDLLDQLNEIEFIKKNLVAQRKIHLPSGQSTTSQRSFGNDKIQGLHIRNN